LIATRVLLLLSALLALEAGSCKSKQMQSSEGLTDSRSDPGIHAGSFVGLGGFGREMAAFLPCGISEAWWLKFDGRSPELHKLLAVEEVPDLSARLEDCARRTGLVGCDKWVYLELDGVRSGPGQYGHLGGYSRELRVRKVVRATRDAPPTCIVRRLTGR